MTITKEEAKLLLIRPVVSSNIISETKAREIEAYNMAIKALSEPKTGEWVLSHVGTIAEGYYCSRCGKHGHRTDFCPNCGARMFR